MKPKRTKWHEDDDEKLILLCNKHNNCNSSKTDIVKSTASEMKHGVTGTKVLARIR